MGLLRLVDKHSVDRLEAACRKALSFTPTPSYKSIKNILYTESDQIEMLDKKVAIQKREQAAMHLQEALITTGGKES